MVGCGKSTGADVLGVESEPWVFKGGVSGEVQVCGCIMFKMDFENDPSYVCMLVFLNSYCYRTVIFYLFFL